MKQQISASKVTLFAPGEDAGVYSPGLRRWQGISTVECTGSRVWAAWMAGGIKEPDPENHIVLAYSDDGGKSWVDPFLVIDDRGSDSRGRDPVLWKDPGGKLCLFYAFSGDDFTNVLEIGNPAGDIGQLSVGRPHAVFPKGMLLNKPIVTAEGECLCMFDPFDGEKGYSYNCCYASCDGGKTWRKRGEVPSRSPNKLFQEGTLVERKDGSLWCITRIELADCGGLEQSFSYDGGKTWSVSENCLAYPFYGPGSKCCLRRLRSGNLLFVNNDSAVPLRVNMAAYLSRDEGKTWTALLLDGREGCAYPDAAEDDEGNIYIIFDCGRSTRNEIRICRFREEDIEAGAFLSPAALQMAAVAKDGAWSDVVSAVFLSDTAVRLKDERGRECTLFGRWQGKRTCGEYLRAFVCGGGLEKYRLTDPCGMLVRRAPKTSQGEKK